MRSLAAGVVGIFFLWAIWNAAQTGYARSLAENGSETRQLSLADKAVKLSPSDPETHYNRAALLWAADDRAGAIAEAERAVALRPRDYFLWFRLGFYRYSSEDKAGALAPFREATRLAPYYAQPHFFIGNILLHEGQLDEAFAELRRATASDPEFLPDVITLAGETFGDDTKSIEQAIQPQTRGARLALAHYFVQHGKTDEAVKLFRAAASPSEQDQHGFLTELLRAKRFPEAYEVWASSRDQSAANIGQVTDGGFEGRISLNDPGFGWQQARDLQGLQVSLDTTEPRSGAQSILLVFKGQTKRGAAVLTQLVLVAPNTRYRLRFATRTKDVVTGGLPIIAVLDANNQKALAETNPLVQNTSGEWQDYAVDFVTEQTTSAIIISLQRRNCSASPCPIFGRLWLDDFSINRMH